MDCSHQRLVLVSTVVRSSDSVYQCESCQHQFRVTSSNISNQCITMKSVSSSHPMEIDINNDAAIPMEVVASISQPSQQQPVNSSIGLLENEFEFLEALGQGGFGLVAKHKSKNDGMIYAIKKTQVKNNEREIEKEVKVLSALQHDNIVRYYSCWTESCSSYGHVLYIQMEFCEKRTLREAIDSGDLVIHRFRMWKLFRQIVEGISYFHSKNVIHRDLKVCYININYMKFIKFFSYIILASKYIFEFRRLCENW